MIEIQMIDGIQYYPLVREIIREYLQWVGERIKQEYGVTVEVEQFLEKDMQELHKYMPPSGRLLLGTVDGRLAGIACLKRLTEDCGEVKRIYVRPEARKLGLGRALLAKLIAEAAEIGYPRIRLDSARFMTDAHRLYQKLGFVEIKPYAGSEVPPDFYQNAIFMQKNIAQTDHS